MNKYIISGVEITFRNLTKITACIYGKSFNFFTGIIDYNKNSSELNWIQNWQQIEVENKIPFIDPNADIQANFIDEPINFKSLVKFGWNSHGTECLPYFDAQDVDVYSELHELSSALSGLELFYYYTEGFGGFIRPRVSTINYYDEIMKL